MTFKCISQKVAQAIDIELMSTSGGFSIDQLMELAGFSVAQAVQKSFDAKKTPSVLICVGPGNNGGDGLVAARHLHHFGFKPRLYYPKQPEKDLYQRLLRQCDNLDIVVDTELDQKGAAIVDQCDIILDALFGFSFHGQVHAPYNEIITVFEQTQKPIVSIDIPSGWDVESGPTEHVKFQPSILVSLTAPKGCSKHFKGQKHFIGGRFVPPHLAAKFELQLPTYPGSDQVVEVPLQQ